MTCPDGVAERVVFLLAERELDRRLLRLDAATKQLVSAREILQREYDSVQCALGVCELAARAIR